MTGLESDIGYGHILRPVCYEIGGPTMGYILEHPRKDDTTKICGCTIYISGIPTPSGNRIPTTTWNQTGTYPIISLSPSIVCGTCGDHGFVRNGRWEAA